MRYIEIKENKIIGHYAGSILPPKKDGIKYIVLEQNAYPKIGDDVSFYEDLKTAKKKSLKKLLDEGLKKIPKGKKLSKDGLSFVDLTAKEKVKAGIIKLKKNEKLDGEDVVAKTKKELFDDGLITKDEYNEHISELRQSAYEKEADPLGFQVIRGEIDKKVWLEKVSEIKKRYKKE